MKTRHGVAEADRYGKSFEDDNTRKIPLLLKTQLTRSCQINSGLENA